MVNIVREKLFFGLLVLKRKFGWGFASSYCARIELEASFLTKLTRYTPAGMQG